MADALIGYTGLVGSNLRSQRRFEGFYNSRNVEELAGRSYGLIACAAAPAVKWKANQEPEADLANLERLMDALRKVDAGHFVLISTVDVYPDPREVDERTPIDHEANHAYGKHRRMLELFVEDRFYPYTIVRLPGLYGTGLKKNVIYDILHDNRTEMIHPEGVFQFYGLDGLWPDVERALDAGLDLVNFATEPVSVREIARESFGLEFDNPKDTEPTRYDMRTVNAELYGGKDGYIGTRDDVLTGIREYVEREGWVRP